jgi:hypothetical protein
MHSWSLVCFTLFTQSAIGLVWVSVVGRWCSGRVQTDFFIWPPVTALILTGLGLFVALAHLARPGLAPHALRNLTASWLSREILSVQAFAGVVFLSILSSLLDGSSVLILLEAAACLLGGAAMFSMTRVYLIKTVPEWNSPATLLEFAGSVILLGGRFRRRAHVAWSHGTTWLESGFYCGWNRYFLGADSEGSSHIPGLVGPASRSEPNLVCAFKIVYFLWPYADRSYRVKSSRSGIDPRSHGRVQPNMALDLHFPGLPRRRRGVRKAALLPGIPPARLVVCLTQR